MTTGDYWLIVAAVVAILLAGVLASVEAAMSAFSKVRADELVRTGRRGAARLRRVLDDGKLPLDNTRSEREIRKIVVGRKNWLFYGSEIHAQAAAAIFSLVASCRLHRIDPVTYLDEVLRVLPYWPRERHLELAPLHWTETRATLSAEELDKPLGLISVPPLATAG